MADFTEARIKRPRVFVLSAYVSAPLTGGFEDWPYNIQDGILEAMERLVQQHQLRSAEIIAAYAGNDLAPLPPYVVVTVAEMLTPGDVRITQVDNIRH